MNRFRMSIYPLMMVTSISPSIISSGDTLYISGTGFYNVNLRNQTRCQFGHVFKNANVIDDTQVVCIAPFISQSSLHHVNITIINPIQSTIFPALLTLLPQSISYTNVSNPSTVVMSQSSFFLNGANFPNTGYVSCRLGNGSLSVGHYISHGAISCPISSLPSTGSYRIYVKFTATSSSWIFTNLSLLIVPDPIFISLHPYYLPLRPNATITVIGQHFTDTLPLSCQFIPSMRTFISTMIILNSTTATCAVNGVYLTGTNITLRVRAHQNVIFPGPNQSFMVFNDSLSSVSPLFGPASGGTIINVTMMSSISSSTILQPIAKFVDDFDRVWTTVGWLSFPLFSLSITPNIALPDSYMPPLCPYRLTVE